MSKDGLEAEDPGGYVLDCVECGYFQETHQGIGIGSPYTGGYVLDGVDCGYFQETHQDIGIGSPYTGGPGFVSCLEIDQAGILEETHQGNSLGTNGSCSKIGEQACSDEIGVRNGNKHVDVEVGVLGVPIEEEMEKVSLVGACNGTIVDSDIVCGEADCSVPMEHDKGAILKENGDGASGVNAPDTDTLTNVDSNVTEKSDAQSAKMVSHKDESDSGSSESDDSSGSSSSSSDEDEDTDDDEEEEEEEEVKGVDIEEGEIRDLEKDEIAFSSGDEEEGAVKGPIKSKNELEILPPVPPVDVVLEPHHQTLPVGVILSIMGTKVIVEGMQKHNPLNEGSILWITDSRLPLGHIDEIFGPVKNPYYVVRYNSEKEVPAGIGQGTAVSFVSDFANYILNDKNLYKKGYDASGENDEELSEELEFSDDEKEAEYKRLRQLAKRGNDGRKKGIQESVGQKKLQVKGRFRKNLQHQVPPSRMSPLGTAGGGQNSIQSLVQGASPPVPPGGGNRECSHGHGEIGASGPPISHMTQPAGDYLGGPTLHSLPPSTPVWSNGMPVLQQDVRLHREFSVNGMQLHQQPNQYHQHHQHQHQHQLEMFTGFPNGLPFQPQFNPGLMQGFPNGVPFQPQFNPSQAQGFPNGIPCQPQFNPSQMQGFPNGIPCQPQFNPNQMQTSSAAPSFGNLCAGSTPTSLGGATGIGCFNQMSFGMGIQNPPSFGGMGGQGDLSSGQIPQSFIGGGFSAPQQFTPGMASNRGRTWPARGGRSNFSGGRGPKQNR